MLLFIILMNDSVPPPEGFRQEKIGDTIYILCNGRQEAPDGTILVCSYKKQKVSKAKMDSDPTIKRHQEGHHCWEKPSTQSHITDFAIFTHKDELMKGYLDICLERVAKYRLSFKQASEMAELDRKLLLLGKSSDPRDIAAFQGFSDKTIRTHYVKEGTTLEEKIKSLIAKSHVGLMQDKGTDDSGKSRLVVMAVNPWDDQMEVYVVDLVYSSDDDTEAYKQAAIGSIDAVNAILSQNEDQRRAWVMTGDGGTAQQAALNENSGHPIADIILFLRCACHMTQLLPVRLCSASSVFGTYQNNLNNFIRIFHKKKVARIFGSRCPKYSPTRWQGNFLVLKWILDHHEALLAIYTQPGVNDLSSLLYQYRIDIHHILFGGLTALLPVYAIINDATTSMEGDHFPAAYLFPLFEGMINVAAEQFPRFGNYLPPSWANLFKEVVRVNILDTQYGHRLKLLFSGTVIGKDRCRQETSPLCSKKFQWKLRTETMKVLDSLADYTDKISEYEANFFLSPLMAPPSHATTIESTIVLDSSSDDDDDDEKDPDFEDSGTEDDPTYRPRIPARRNLEQTRMHRDFAQFSLPIEHPDDALRQARYRHPSTAQLNPTYRSEGFAADVTAMLREVAGRIMPDNVEEIDTLFIEWINCDTAAAGPRNETNAYSYWSQKRAAPDSTFKNLAEFFCRIIVACASEAPCERYFSFIKLYIPPSRSRTNEALEKSHYYMHLFHRTRIKSTSWKAYIK